MTHIEEKVQKITILTIICSESQEKIVIFGLGKDSLIYFWDVSHGEGLLYKHV